MVLRIRWSLPCAWASDTEGSKRDATEPVKALGNIISGIAIPEKTPYNDSAVSSILLRLAFVLFVVPTVGFSGYIYGTLCSQIFFDFLIILALRRYMLYDKK